MHRSSDRKGRAQLLYRSHPAGNRGAVEVTLDNHADRTASRRRQFFRMSALSESMVVEKDYHADNG